MPTNTSCATSRNVSRVRPQGQSTGNWRDFTTTYLFFRANSIRSTSNFTSFSQYVANLFLAALAPPLDDFQTVAGLLVSQSFPGQVIEFDAESEPALQISQQVKGFAEQIDPPGDSREELRNRSGRR